MTFEEIVKDIKKKMEKATITVNDEVQDIFFTNIDKFYGEYTPVSSKRYNQFTYGKAFEPSNVIDVGNGYQGTTEFNKGRHPKSYPGKNGYMVVRKWSEEQILENVMEGDFPHGGYEGADDNTAIWTESMNQIDPNAERRLVEELKKNGLPIK